MAKGNAKENMKPTSEPAAEQEQSQGLKISKKTVITITSLLFAIMIFAGILTQVIPTGSFLKYDAESEVLKLSTDESGTLSLKYGETYTLDDEGKSIQFISAQGEKLSCTADGDILRFEVDENGEYVLDGEGCFIVSDDETAEPMYIKYSNAKMGFWITFVSPILLFTTSDALTGVAVILFIILVGGTFLILDKSGVLKYIMSVIINKFESRKYLLLAIIIFVMMSLSSIVGILEESVTLVPLCVAISIALGWDSLVGISISLVSIAFGYTAATFNPFNIGVVQSLAGITPLFSGLGMRIVLFIAVYGVMLLFVLPYAKKVERNPQKSLSYESDLDLRKKYSDIDRSIISRKELGKATKIFVGCISGVLVCAAISFIVQRFDLPPAVAEYIGYLPMVSMALLFTIGGLVAGKTAGIRGKKLLGGFFDGVKSLAPIMPLIIFILAITYVLKRGMIVDTMLNFIYSNINGMSPYLLIVIICVIILFLEFFIGSGTAKAFLIMPIVLPLAQMMDLSAQSIVLAFCIGDGIGNILYPTSGIMIIAIGLVNVSYGKFLRFTWKLFLMQFALGVLFMLAAVYIGY